MDGMYLGKRIQAQRDQCSMKQADLAEIVGVSSNYISMIECGTKIPRLGTFIKIANALKVPADYLLQDYLDVKNPIVENELSKKLEDMNYRERKRIYEVINVLIKSAK